MSLRGSHQLPSGVSIGKHAPVSTVRNSNIILKGQLKNITSRLQQDMTTHDTSAYSTLDTTADERRFKFPLTSEEALRVLAPYLLDYEKQEIKEFDTIYYFNIIERRKEKSSLTQQSSHLNNYGFDNEN